MNPEGVQKGSVCQAHRVSNREQLNLKSLLALYNSHQKSKPQESKTTVYIQNDQHVPGYLGFLQFQPRKFHVWETPQSWANQDICHPPSLPPHCTQCLDIQNKSKMDISRRTKFSTCSKEGGLRVKIQKEIWKIKFFFFLYTKSYERK